LPGDAEIVKSIPWAFKETGIRLLDWFPANQELARSMWRAPLSSYPVCILMKLISKCQ